MYSAPAPRAGHPPRTLSSQNVVIKQHCSRFILIVRDKTQLYTIYKFPMFYKDSRLQTEDTINESYIYYSQLNISFLHQT